jgi:hypothetical protein
LARRRFSSREQYRTCDPCILLLLLLLLLATRLLQTRRVQVGEIGGTVGAVGGVCVWGARVAGEGGEMVKGHN